MEGFGRGFFPTFGGAGLVGVLGIRKKGLWRRFEKALKREIEDNEFSMCNKDGEPLTTTALCTLLDKKHNH